MSRNPEHAEDVGVRVDARKVARDLEWVLLVRIPSVSVLEELL